MVSNLLTIYQQKPQLKSCGFINIIDSLLQGNDKSSCASYLASQALLTL